MKNLLFRNVICEGYLKKKETKYVYNSTIDDEYIEDDVSITLNQGGSCEQEIYEFDGYDIVDNTYIYSIFTIYSIEEILRMDFEILDISKLADLASGVLENEINNIKEIEVDEHGGFIEPETKKWKGRKMDIVFANKINELVRAVNFLGGKNE